MISEEIKSKIFSEYDRNRQKAEYIAFKKVKEIHKNIPRLSEIDREIDSLGKKNVLNLLTNKEKSEEIQEKFKRNITALEDERKELLKKNNIPLDYKVPKYTCPECKDRGILENGNKCQCYKQKITNELYNISNFGDVLNKQNFETFSFDYYSKEKGEKLKSPYENMKKIYDAAKKFCQLDSKIRESILYYGDVGLGKTFLSSCIAKELIDKGETVIYMRATKLFNMYEDHKFNRSKDSSFLKNIYDCDLLIIDDLGTENINKMNVSFIFDIIDERITRGKSIIINTNLDMDELKENYTKRFISRVADNFKVYEFYGSDIRLEKLKK